ncbi:MAG: MOSC domain-containing protein [Sphingomonadales bacterium 32-68-7]|nr:MAG: MOSC domain-containing protein [Sphingomonadales bacterium 12-68-11]OYX09168.1 MAG: MOSC domain-containing protein [Sphingomonadales bacterium 32-68-7]
METLSTVTVTAAEGLHGDFRGALAATKPGRRRQVSLLEADSWAAAQADVGAQVDWWQARRNLLIAGVRIPREVGARVAIGEALVIEITGECDPCDRMDALHAGLRAGMTPDWRGGFCGRVIADGEIAVGDEVRILR